MGAGEKLLTVQGFWVIEGRGEKNPKNVWINHVVKAAVKRKEAAWHERRYWELGMRLRKTKAWKFTEKNRERLKVYIPNQKGNKSTVWKEDESRCR